MSDLTALRTTVDVTDVVGQLARRSRRIYANDALRFATWLEEHNLTIPALTFSRMVQYRGFLEDTYRPATAQRMFSVARRILEDYVRKGVLARNPCEGIRGFSVENESTHTALKQPEARAVLAAIDRSTKRGLRDYALLVLLLRTGLRRAECAALTLGDFTEQQGHTVVTIQHGKGDKRRIAKVPDDVLRCIQAYLEGVGRQNAAPSAPLFVGFRKGDHPTEEGISDKVIERTVAAHGSALGIKLTPHDLRATFITLALEGGAALHQVQYAAGHARPETTERYHKRKLNLDDNAVDYVRL